MAMLMQLSAKLLLGFAPLSAAAFHGCVPDFVAAFDALRTRAAGDSEVRDAALSLYAGAAALAHNLLVLHPGYDSLYAALSQRVGLVPAPALADMECTAAMYSWAPAIARHLGGTPSPAGSGRPVTDFPADVVGGGGTRADVLSQPAGLINLGNTCYCNAVLQALYRTPGFRSLILTCTAAWAEQSMVSQLQLLFAQLLASEQSVIAPARVMKLLPEVFRHGWQQDADELLKVVLDRVESGVGSLSAGRQLLRAEFGLPLAVTTCCSSCGALSTKTEVTVDLLVPLRDALREGAVALQTLLDDVFLAESLSAETSNAYQCDSPACNRALRSASRTTRVAVGPMFPGNAAPRQLCITLGRFAYDRAAQARRKVSTAVDIPRVLSVDTLLGVVCSVDGRGGGAERAPGEADVLYDLYALVVHAGSSPDHGHYYTYAAAYPASGAAQDDQWFCLDDSRVQVSSAAAALQSSVPYLLFYSCRSAVPLGEAALACDRALSPALAAQVRALDMHHARSEHARAASRTAASGRNSASVSGADPNHDDDDANVNSFARDIPRYGE